MAKLKERMPKNKKEDLVYKVIFEQDVDGIYIAKVPALPGCFTQGDTFEEAKEYIKDAIIGYIEVLEELGEEIPLDNNDSISTQITIEI